MTSRTTSVSRTIAASPAALFAVVSDASLHPVIDGSGTVRAAAGNPERLVLGSKFGMKMHLGLPYRISNRVVEFEQDRLIAWAHAGKHRWRYTFEPVIDVDDPTERTIVTETFDWSTARSPKFIEMMGYPTKHIASMEQTLERLEAFALNRPKAP